MPAKRARVMRGEDFQREAVRKIMARNGERGAVAAVAKELDVSPSLVNRWLQKHGTSIKRELTRAANKTLVSFGPGEKPAEKRSAPNSGPVSVSGPLPAVPTVTLAGLEEYINALVDRRVAEQFKLRLRMMDQVG